MPTLSTHKLVKKFDGVHAIKHLSVSFDAGKITGIIGPNGSGKSTLVNTLTGMVPMDGGTIVVVRGGVASLSEKTAHTTAHTTTLTRMPAYDVPAHGITRTFQDVRLFEQMPVIDNIFVVLTERSIWKSLFESRRSSRYATHLAIAEAMLRKVDLWEKRNDLAHDLSYGQRKLLEIARVLAMVESKKIGDATIATQITTVFFDEPFAGLFPEMIKTVATIMRELRDRELAVILIEHNMDLIRELSDHVYVLDSGELLAEGNPTEILARREVVEAYLGE